MSGFVAGLLHPLALPAHVLALLALGLLIGQQTARTRHVSLAAFVASAAVGLSAIAVGVGQTSAAAVVRATAIASGATGAHARPRAARGGAGGAALAGGALGLDTPPAAI